MLFQVTPHADGDIEISNLNKDIDSTIKLKASYAPTKKLITLGRDATCDIPFPKEKGFSRIHASFTYDNANSYWVLRDGIIGKSSTNGTWLFALHSYPIYDGMLIEILQSRLKITFQ